MKIREHVGELNRGLKDKETNCIESFRIYEK